VIQRLPLLPPRRAAAVLGSLVLAFAMLVPQVAAKDTPATYTVQVGYSEPANGVNIDAYFPDRLTVHVGDTVKFVQDAAEIHTVTFLAPGQDAPNLESSLPVLDPQVYFPVVPADDSYDGTSYANSGIMSTDPSYFLDGQPVTSFSLTFTKPGSFQYFCVVHGNDMAGTIYVVDPSVKIPAPGQVRSQAKDTISTLLEQVPGTMKAAESAVAPPVDNGDGTTTYHVNAGFVSGRIGLMSFFPSQLKVHPGDTVIWHLVTAPHTITFLNGNAEPALVVPASWPPPDGTTPTVMLDPAILAPSGNVPQPPDLAVLNTTDLFNSGFMPAPGPNPSMDFAMTIGDIQGQVPYLCLLHDASGMTGKLVVVPSA